jgi:hypothetical protein
MRIAPPLLVLMLLSACQQNGGDTALYSVRAVEGPNPKLPDDKVFVPNARQLLPSILASCGVTDFREFPYGEKGEISFKFELAVRDEKTVARCINAQAHGGVTFEPEYTI